VRHIEIPSFCIAAGQSFAVGLRQVIHSLDPLRDTLRVFIVARLPGSQRDHISGPLSGLSARFLSLAGGDAYSSGRGPLSFPARNEDFTWPLRYVTIGKPIGALST
jgi:hypothetical protein